METVTLLRRTVACP